MTVRVLPIFLSVVAMSFGSVSLACAQEDIAAGEALATNECAACHAVRAGESASPNSDAPAFEEVANTPGMTAMAIEIFLQSPHASMPLFVLDADEIEDVTAYIQSLKKTSP